MIQMNDKQVFNKMFMNIKKYPNNNIWVNQSHAISVYTILISLATKIISKPLKNNGKRLPFGIEFEAEGLAYWSPMQITVTSNERHGVSKARPFIYYF